MAFEKFKPVIWAKNIEEGLKREAVYYEDCNHDYEGDAKKPGDTIKILGLGEPTLRHWSDGKLHALDEPETIEDLSMVIPINQVCDYNFFVDDLDKRQTEGNFIDKYTQRARYKIQNQEDQYVANFALSTAVKKVTTTLTTDTIKANRAFLDLVDNAYATLMMNDVPSSKDVVLTIDWKYLNVLRNQYQELDTNNHEMVGNGKVGRYHNIIVKVSNNIATKGAKSYFQLKTRDAISFVRPYTYLEAYKPEKHFGDAVKGYTLFDGAVTAPKEIVAIEVPTL